MKATVSNTGVLIEYTFEPDVINAEVLATSDKYPTPTGKIAGYCAFTQNGVLNDVKGSFNCKYNEILNPICGNNMAFQTGDVYHCRLIKHYSDKSYSEESFTVDTRGYVAATLVQPVHHRKK